jgi:hypothetical protein
MGTTPPFGILPDARPARSPLRKWGMCLCMCVCARVCGGPTRPWYPRGQLPTFIHACMVAWPKRAWNPCWQEVAQG